MMINDITDELPKHSYRTYGKRYLDKIEFIALHHTGGNGTIKGFAKYHVSKGWPGIGYHYVIDRNANIHQTNRIDTVSYNVARTNSKVIGIAVIGNYDDQVLTIQQKVAIEDLVKLLRSLIGHKPVKGHGEFKATDCPGKHIREFIKELNP